MAKLAIIFILFAALLFVHRSVVSGLCHLDFPPNRRNMPSYKKSFGSNWIKIPFRQQKAVIREDEHIDVYCASGISDFYDVFEEKSDNYPYYPEKRNHLISGLRRVNIYCKDQKMRYTDGHALVENELNCADLKWSMYESAKPFAWCESGMNSYLLATKSLGVDLILAATCFDIEKIAIRNLYYYIGPNTYTVDLNEVIPVVTPSELLNASLGAEVKNFKTGFDISGMEWALNFNSVYNEWLKVAQFEYHSLVEGALYDEYFREYESVLNIIWWPSLRNGNWRRFVRALEKRAKSYAYNVYAGSSGAVRVPQRNKCSPSDILELQFGDVNQTIPAYVWSYVQAVDGSEEFVVVGYNSPFFNFYEENEIVFCKDVCDRISWLDDVRSTFRYSALGIIFCCEVDAVRAANSLDGFPLKVMLPPTTTTVEPMTAEVTDVTITNELTYEQYDEDANDD